MLYYNSDNFKLFKGDSLNLLKDVDDKSVDLVFADPPYFLSNGGISCKNGKMVSVNKAKWDVSKGLSKDFEFNFNWIKECNRILKKDGSIWISGTFHNIYQIGFALQLLNYKVLNEISWFKPNAPPNLSCRYFTHSHETLIWAAKNNKSKHKFNYDLMKKWDDKISSSGKQMRSVWSIPFTPKSEKVCGRHPTQKPLELLRRIILSSTNKNDVVLDPFNGSGTTGIIANKFERSYIGMDNSKTYLDITLERFKNTK